ncbi:MAG: glycosyltransferase [Cyanobacteria bacterium J06634_5]
MSMRIGLCMMVKNEAARIEDCLKDIVDLFEQVVVFDTGSEDNTQEILRDRLDIEPIPARLNEARCQSFGDLRNQGIAKLETPWVFCLDADERVERSQLQALTQSKNLAENDEISGYFCAWPTYHGDRVAYTDYKLPLFKREIKRVGLVHDNVQLDIRVQKGRAVWQDNLILRHYPEQQRKSQKSQFYLQRLFCATQQEPQGYRYYWFIGYTYFHLGEYDKAVYYLSITANSHAHQFPVECLNSKMVLADIQARQGKQAEVKQTLLGAIAFYKTVADDFEVKINFRLKPWLNDALDKCSKGQLDHIKAYLFSY